MLNNQSQQLQHQHQQQQQQQQQQQHSLNKPFSGAEENRQYLRAFIHTYRNLPVLWDTSLRDYTNRDKRADAYQQLVPIYRYLKRDATLEDVKKKINTLRTNYRKELKVVESSRREGNVYQPRCWTFYELDFLRNAEKFLAINPHIKTENSFVLNEHTANQFLDLYGIRNMSNATPPPNISEMFHKSFGQGSTTVTPPTTQHKIDQQTGNTPSGGDSNQSAVVIHARQPPYAANSLHNNHNNEAAKRPRTNGCRAKTEEAFTMASEYLSANYPEEESLARTWTFKLKRLTREQRLLAEKFIGDILFEAELGTLHRGSMQLNAFEPYVRFEENTSEETEKSQSPQATVTIKPMIPDNTTVDVQTPQIKVQSVDETTNQFDDYN